MRIEQRDPSDEKTARACYDVTLAAHEADEPIEPPLPYGVFSLYLREGWEKTPGEVWVAFDDGGTVVGYYRMNLADLENLDRVPLNLVVHPARRRGGLGTALLRHAASRAAASGRAVLDGGVQEGSAGEAFALRFGAESGMENIRRVLDLEKLPAGKLTRLREAAAKAAAGYSLVRWEGVTPDARLDQVASLLNALNDAPRDSGVEALAWDAQRVRDRHNASVARSPYRRYSLAAVDDATGEMAALTVVSVDRGIPDWAHQLVTVVTRPHRGHRLGLLTKAAMMDWLAEAEPQAKRIVTWNAASNRHMIEVNEELGYEVWGRPYRSVELPVSSVVKA